MLVVATSFVSMRMAAFAHLQYHVVFRSAAQSFPLWSWSHNFILTTAYHIRTNKFIAGGANSFSPAVGVGCVQIRIPAYVTENKQTVPIAGDLVTGNLG